MSKFPKGKFADDEIREILSQIPKGSCWTTRWIKQIYSDNQERFDNIIKEFNCDISGKWTKERYVYAFYTDDLTKCEVCGKGIIKPKFLCSSIQCQGKSQTVKDKRAKTNLEKFGVENPFTSEVCKAKSRETSLRKYGVEYHTMTPEYKKFLSERAKHTTPEQRQEILAKQRQTMLERYGVPHNELMNRPHLDDYNDEYILEHFLDGDTWKFKEFIAYFGLSRRGAKLRLQKIDPNIKFPHCNKSQHEFFESIPAQDKKEDDRTLIAPQEIDILIPSAKLAIEFNGVYWHSTIWKDSKYHQRKTELVESKGYQLLHIFEGDDLDKFRDLICTKLKLNQKIYARKCTIKEITSQEAYDFLGKYHIQGACHAKINLGLFYNNELTEVMTFSKSRFNHDYQYELIRLCTKSAVTVVGGASKLFNHFVRVYNPESVISYANRRFSKGDVYKKLGFKLLHKTDPNYFWCNGTDIISRMKTQRHKLDGYPEGVSESQIMQSKGYMKVYDAGNLAFGFRNRK